MSIENPNLLLLESVAHSLGSLCDRFVFMGGCAIGLLITDPAAAPVRATQDVDVIVEVTSFAYLLGDSASQARRPELIQRFKALANISEEIA